MPSSRQSSRNDLVESSFSRMSVSLCCTSGWSTMVTPCMLPPVSKHRPVTDDLQRRTAVGPQLFCDVATGRPSAALQDFRERQRLAIHVQTSAHQVCQTIEQGNG